MNCIKVIFCPKFARGARRTLDLLARGSIGCCTSRSHSGADPMFGVVYRRFIALFSHCVLHTFRLCTRTFSKAVFVRGIATTHSVVRGVLQTRMHIVFSAFCVMLRAGYPWSGVLTVAALRGRDRGGSWRRALLRAWIFLNSCRNTCNADALQGCRETA